MEFEKRKMTVGKQKETAITSEPVFYIHGILSLNTVFSTSFPVFTTGNCRFYLFVLPSLRFFSRMAVQMCGTVKGGGRKSEPTAGLFSCVA